MNWNNFFKRLEQEFDQFVEDNIRCYTEEEVAEKFSVSRDTLRRERANGNIKAVTIRNTIRYPHDELVRYLESRTLG